MTPSLAPGLIPAPATTLIFFHYTHPQTLIPAPATPLIFLPLHSPPKSKLSPLSYPHPRPQDAHPPDSMWKGVGIVKVLPLGWADCASREKNSSYGQGAGGIQFMTWEALGRKRYCHSSHSQEHLGQSPLATGSPCEPVGVWHSQSQG